MCRLGLAFALAILAPIAFAETISFEIYALEKDRGRRLLAKGLREYTLKDVEIEKSWPIGPRFWNKEIRIANGFAVGASIFPDDKLSGFGMWLKRHGDWYEFWKTGGFSWEWFDPESATIYRKLQGPGRIRIATTRANGFDELTSVEFLDDITFRLKDDLWFFFSDNDTHQMIIGKGSVLRLAP